MQEQTKPMQSIPARKDLLIENSKYSSDCIVNLLELSKLNFKGYNYSSFF